MPAAEVEVSEDLVRRLVADQHPDLAGLPVRMLANGWDNVQLRLGEALVVRLPRREMAAVLVEHEQRWLPELRPRLPLPVPAPVRVGRPALGYPWSWSIVPYLPGQVAFLSPPTDLHDAAVRLGGFLGALHTAAPSEAPANPVRGVPLADRAASTTQNLQVLGDLVDQGRVRRAWASAIAVPRWHGPPAWVHGDLHPANLLVHDGVLSGVLDFGDVTAGDPATDLAVAWMLLPPAHHEAFRSAYGDAGGAGVDGDTWARARGWALTLSVAFLANSADNPLIAGIGRSTLRAALT